MAKLALLGLGVAGSLAAWVLRPVWRLCEHGTPPRERTGPLPGWDGGTFADWAVHSNTEIDRILKAYEKGR